MAFFNTFSSHIAIIYGHFQNSVHKNWLFVDIYTCVWLRSHNYTIISVTATGFELTTT